MSWLKNINPTPAFPAYTGPHKVGSIDVEIPISDLENPSDDAPPADIPTVAFRVFYPCRQDSEQKAVRWIPSPQREYIAAYARFLGANSAFAGLFSLFPQLLQFTSIPVHSNADILEPNTRSKRWPVMLFSHGLGGSRNAYSHICGSLASHGIVVVAPDHRDGSSPISFTHGTNAKDKTQRIEYKRIDHKPSTDVYNARDGQLRIRLWEMGLIHDALLKIDTRQRLTNVAEDATRNGGKDMLTMFSHLLAVHEPGSISLAGHSFGAATTVQFVKSVYYNNNNTNTPSAPPTYKSLFTPRPSSALKSQITPSTPIILLDLWTLPIQSPATAWLRSRPMPSYTSPTGGTNTLAILSESFFNWTSNKTETLRIVAAPPSAPAPHVFYPVASAHLSQSDFGVLFPWATAKVFGARDPERVLRLNTRAILQLLRNSGAQVARTSVADLELEGVDPAREVENDDKILSSSADAVRGWVSLGEEAKGQAAGRDEKVGMGPGEAALQGEAFGQAVEAR